MASPNNTTQPSEGDLQLAIHGLGGILQALNWLDDGLLDGGLTEEQIGDARKNLIVAGLAITENITERF